MDDSRDLGRPMRLAYIADARLPTEKAHGRQIIETCLALARLGHDVRLIHPGRAQPDGRRADLDVPGLDVHVVPRYEVLDLEGRVPLPLLQAGLRVSNVRWTRRAVMAAGAVDLIVTREAAAAHAASVRGIRAVLELHTELRRGLRGLMRRADRRLFSVAVLTDAARDRVRREPWAPERVQTVRGGVDLEPFASVPDAAACRRAVGLSPDHRHVGYVGRFITMGRRKGVEELVASIGSLPPDVRLVLVGGPEDAVTVPDEVAHRVIRPGTVPAADVPLWLGACDVLCAPYPRDEHFETYAGPVKLFEYLAAGRPIVATDIASVREILTPDDDAVLVPPLGAGALIHGLRRVLGDEPFATRLAERARRAAAAFTFDGKAAALLDLAPTAMVHRVGAA